MRIIYILLFTPFLSSAQLIINDNLDYNFIGDQFLGPDFAVSNIERWGYHYAIGQFDATNTYLPIEKGIILTTGTVQNTPDGPYGPNDSPNSGFDNGAGGDALLDEEIISETPTYNSARLEFDFIPQIDSLYLKYLFASEEYPEYVGSSFNDLFRIYISGPGYQENTNIAVLANGSPVEVNTVNNGISNSGPCVNCTNYVSYGNGSQFPFNSNQGYFQYDGYTTGIPAVARNLMIDSTYHIIFVIADVGDPVWDSALFIESCNHCNYQVSNNELIHENIQLFPNPVHQGGLIETVGMKEDFQILRTNGQIVQEGNSAQMIQLRPELGSGYYFFRSGNFISPLIIE